jgi:DNA-directed RNA polymerase subunit RPC12/RpoP
VIEGMPEPEGSCPGCDRLLWTEEDIQEAKSGPCPECGYKALGLEMRERAVQDRDA